MERYWQIDYTHLDNNKEGNGDAYAEKSMFLYASDMADIFGDPQVLPRVGEEYQAKIPPLIAECDRLQLINGPKISENTIHAHSSHLLGLPIPLMWSNIELENINGNLEVENSEENQMNSDSKPKELKIELVDTISGYEKGMASHSNVKEGTGGDKMEVDLALPLQAETKTDQVKSGFCSFPGYLGEAWTDVERESFLLGLYIFGKNLILVKRFVESKGVGDILSFYYGKFYRSDGYQKWSESRKLKGRRSVHGQKIFMGWRQQELLSRLSSHVSQECQNMLIELSKLFEEGKVSFEEYVFTLKNAVGINMLIEAVGIGKGKQDLTGTAMEPIKPNQSVSVRLEIPVGKACSSLTSAEIVKFLTGDFRLSKARSNDLFWEAVWPRLLARGWHSEQPKDHGIAGIKHPLVFLVPNVKKFSRRRLVKGKHYFDSVSDVLNKVASDPGLLELESNATKDDQHKEDCGSERDHNGSPNKQRHRYLQPRNNSNGSLCVHKFTIVDTSLGYGEDRPKIRELRSLPAEITSVSTSSSLSSESEGLSDESEEEAGETNTSNPREDAADRRILTDSSDCINSLPNNGVPNVVEPTVQAVENHKNQSSSIVSDKQQEKTMKYRFSRKVKTGRTKNLVPITKEQDLTAADHIESSCSTKTSPVDRKVNDNESHSMSNSPDAGEDMVLHEGQTQNLSPASSLAKDSPEGSNEGIVDGISLGREISPEKPHSPKMIDLNIPHISPDFAADGALAVDVTQNDDKSCVDKPSIPSEASQQHEDVKLPDARDPQGDQLVINRRQSTRNRPLTTKALEALELGFLSTGKKRKGGDSTSRSSRRARRRTGVKTTFNDDSGNEVVDSSTEKFLDGFHNNNVHMIGESKG